MTSTASASRSWSQRPVASKTLPRPGRKGQWPRNASDKIPTHASNVRAFTYFDVDVDVSATENVNWLLDTSQSSLDGFKTLALNPFFDTQP